MSGRESFGIGLEKSGLHPQTTAMQTMRLAYSAEGTPVYKPVTAPTPQFSSATGITTTGGAGAGAGAGGGAVVGSNDASPTTGIVPYGANAGVGDQVKRKRGRPRKYGPDGAMALGLSPVSPAGSTPTSAGSGLPSPTDASMRKARGRPPGSGKKQQMAALGSAGVGFTPHVITVKAGEDVSSKIMSFSQNGPRAICILSANGALSNVTLRQAATSGTVTYEGRFEILSLSGSFLLTENGGQRSRTGGLSVSLAGSDGRVLGGGVAGLLTAASPVQVVVGSFIAEGRKESKSYISSDPSSLQPKLVPCGGNTGAVSPPSRGTLSESSGGAGSPLNQSTGACNNNNSNNNPHSFGNMPWK